MSLHVIILAAGQGTRMKSSLPKVLHQLAGKPLLAHVIATARQLKPHMLHVVYGHGGEMVQSRLDAPDIEWVYQEEQHGTGHAVQLAAEHIDDNDSLCVMYGDVPLLTSNTVHELLAVSDELGVLTANMADPGGYGRIIRDDADNVIAIVEERDANEQQKHISEINTGIMAGKAGTIKELLNRINRDNDQGELYLTDIVELAVQSGTAVNDYCTNSEEEITGINDRLQLAMVERRIQQNIADDLMRAGVTLLDPGRFDVRGQLVCGRDVVIDINCVIEGNVTLADGVVIGPNVCLKDCSIGANTQVRANTVIEGAEIGCDVMLGPFARIRPDTKLADHVHIGNFVEVKKSTIGAGSKVNHLSYVGDATLGKRVNIGAGTITCNYDGGKKHQTVIEDDVFIGSGTELVAPITVGAGSTTGAGSSLSKDIDQDTLVVERSKPRVIRHWQRPSKK